MDTAQKQRLIPYALGEKKPELVLKNVKIVDVYAKRIRTGDIAVQDGRIVGVGQYSGEREVDLTGRFAAPGFVDAHVHIESSMVSPQLFAEQVLRCGTTAVIADPHEIVNVAGLDGIRYMLNASHGAAVSIYFMLPSCVPVNQFDHNGAVFGAEQMAQVLNHPAVLGLGEVMNYPALLNGEKELLDKIGLCSGKTIDGHAPSVNGKGLQAYRLAGIETDHECIDYPQALERVQAGFTVQVREGSAAKNLTAIVSGALQDGLDFDQFVFCTDDLHLDHVISRGHINYCIKKAVALGVDPVSAIRCATLNAAKTYGLKDMGAIVPGYRADIVILNNLEKLNIIDVYKNGISYKQTRPANQVSPPAKGKIRHSVNIPALSKDCLSLPQSDSFPVITVIPGEIVTKKELLPLPGENGMFRPGNGLQKLAVIQRHDGTGRIGVGVIKGFGLKGGAIASTVAHDSHNLVVLGDNDGDMLCAVEELRRCQGGYTVCSGGKVLKTLPLPIAGLFTEDPAQDVVGGLKEMADLCHKMGVPQGIDPFQNLSFVSLPVIPEIRLMDNGIFDVVNHCFI